MGKLFGIILLLGRDMVRLFGGRLGSGGNSVSPAVPPLGEGDCDGII